MPEYQLPKMPLVKRADGWWITECISWDVPECGPYDTKKEAEEDRAGLRQAYLRSPEIFFHPNGTPNPGVPPPFRKIAEAAAEKQNPPQKKPPPGKLFALED